MKISFVLESGQYHLAVASGYEMLLVINRCAPTRYREVVLTRFKIKGED